MGPRKIYYTGYKCGSVAQHLSSVLEALGLSPNLKIKTKIQLLLLITAIVILGFVVLGTF